MGRKIILLSDGTGNSAAKVWRTNVWRTFEALDLSGNDQVAYYDDGVGTSSFKPLAVIGGVFGYGLKRNVIAIYKFACRNCRDDPARAADQIYAFGFSRGAFTIRIVVGMILSEGLVRADNESDLQRGAVDAYRRYRRKTSHTLWPGKPEDMFRDVRDAALEAFRWLVGARPLPPPNAHFKVRFVGVWDTVAAYGLPIDEMTRGVSNWILPLALPNHRFDPTKIDRGCQALALDEERTTFHPELWSEDFGTPPTEVDITQRRFVGDETVSQIWFSGVHSNIGGGYPDDSLAYIPFLWMISEAQRAGLHFKSDAPNDAGLIVADPDTFKSAMSKADKDGRMYDPRKGLGGYYRYGPRKLVEVCTPRFRKKEDDEIVVHRPKIHETVFKRIGNNAHGYAPIGLPAIYDIVTMSGEILTPDQYRALHPHLGETNLEAAHRAAAQEHVWNEVWKRRCTYFATLLATFWLLGFPFLSDPDRNAETYSHIRWVSTLLRTLGGFLPGFASPWIDGYARQPLTFAASAMLVAVCLSLGAYQAGRIRDLMGSLWQRLPYRPQREPKNSGIYWLRSKEIYKSALFNLKRRWAPGFFALIFIYLAYVGLNKLAFIIYDTAGGTCVEATKANGLPPPVYVDMNTPRTAEFDIAEPCNRTGIFVESNSARYRITIKMGREPEDQWRDGTVAMPPGGFIGSEADPRYLSLEDLQKPNHLIEAASWNYRLAMLAYLPFRRIYQHDWFRIIVRVGAVGAIETVYRPDPHDRVIQWTIRPRRQGELFVYVNDSVLGLPTVYGLHYKDNFGKGTILVERF